jgi:cbb3-type cytochrome oxidase subunit 3
MGGGELFPRREKLKLIQLVLFIGFFVVVVSIVTRHKRKEKERERHC